MSRRRSEEILEMILKETKDMSPEERLKYLAFVMWELIKIMCVLEKELSK